MQDNYKKKGKKIKLLIVGVGGSELGGIETLFYGMFKSGSEAFDISFLSFGTKVAFNKVYKKNGYNLYDIPTRKSNPFLFSRNVKQFFIEHNDYDYIWVNTSSSSMYEIQYYGRRMTGAKIITHSHGTKIEISSGLLYYFGNLLLGRIHKNKVLKNTDIFFACSTEAGRALFGKKYDDKTVIIHNGIDATRFSFNLESRMAIRNEYDVADNTIVIGIVGRLSQPKNVNRGIEIFKEFNLIVDDSLLFVTGDGPLKDSVENKVKELNISDKVYFLGMRKDVEKVYSGIDILLMPSLFEGLPLGAVEAQSEGLTCFLSDVITKEVAITDLVNFISLNSSSKYWAECMKKKYVLRDRSLYSKTISEKNFDVQSTIKHIEHILS